MNERIEPGFDVHLCDPRGNETGAAIHILFGDSARKALSELQLQGKDKLKKIDESNKPKKLNRPGFRGFRPDAQQPAEQSFMPEDADPYLIDFMAACTASWNLSKSGERLECNRENAVRIYTDYPLIKTQVYDEIENRFGLEDFVNSPVFKQTDHVSSQASRRYWAPWNRSFAEGNFELTARESVDYSRETLTATPGHSLILKNNRTLPLWEGEAVKNLAVMFFGGYGDSIMFGRYLHALCWRAERVSAIVQNPLYELFAKNAPSQVDVFDRDHCSDGLKDADAHIYPFCLPHETGQGYGEAAWIKNWSHDATNFLTTRPARIGINWTGSTENPNNALRSIQVDQFAAWLEIPGIEWHSLQADRRVIPPKGVIDHAAELRDFLATAELIATLDLVISIDSAVVNLSASMGFPTWALLEPAGYSDFRWGMGEDRTPWLPSARMFRQGNNKKWKPVIRRVRDALVEWMKNRCDRRSPMPIPNASATQARMQQKTACVDTYPTV